MTYTCTDTTSVSHYLCADIGGTNFRLAALKLAQGTFSILRQETLSTSNIQNPSEYFSRVRTQWQTELGISFTAMGLALAGPVNDQVCRMTNANLEVDGKLIQASLGIPVLLLNDLAAVTWGIAAIDHQDSSGLTHLGGPTAQAVKNPVTRKSVVAPGTGLGVGGLVQKNGVTAVLDTESGHIDFAPRGAESVRMQEFIASRFPQLPGYEQFVSGLGFEFLFEYYLATHPTAESPAIEEVQSTAGPARGAIISKRANEDPHCAAVMQLFVEYLGRFSSTIALTHLPRQGLYLAGGVPGKNIPWFVNENRFMNSFLANYLPPIRDLLSKIPVYLVNDNDIGLYGAANACHNEAR